MGADVRTEKCFCPAICFETSLTTFLSILRVFGFPEVLLGVCTRCPGDQDSSVKISGAPGYYSVLGGCYTLGDA